MMDPLVITMSKMDWGKMRIFMSLTIMKMLPARLTRTIWMHWTGSQAVG